MDGCDKPQPKTKRSLCRRSALRHSGFLQLTRTRIEQLTEEGHYTGGIVAFGYKRDIVNIS